MTAAAQELEKPISDLDSFLVKQVNILAASLDKAVWPLLSEYGQLQQAGKKGKLSHIYLSFLLSGVLCKTPWLRIDLFDENDRSDSAECTAEWDVPCISDNLYRDVAVIAKQRDRIKDFELEQMWLEGAEEYAAALERALPLVVERCAAAEQCGSCTWHYGQYLGATVTVREKTS